MISRLHSRTIISMIQAWDQWKQRIFSTCFNIQRKADTKMWSTLCRTKTCINNHTIMISKLNTVSPISDLRFPAVRCVSLCASMLSDHVGFLKSGISICCDIILGWLVPPMVECGTWTLCSSPWVRIFLYGSWGYNRVFVLPAFPPFRVFLSSCRWCLAIGWRVHSTVR